VSTRWAFSRKAN